MPQLVIDLPEVPLAPVQGTDAAFPVRRVYCIGRNYAAHAIEMGHDPDREAPFFFQKNPDNLDFSGRFPYPPHSSDVHHEVELVVALGRGGSNIPTQQALDHVWGYAVALDMTRRDLQGVAKAKGLPWEVAKAFEQSAPMGPLRPAAEIGHPTAGQIVLRVNGEIRQEGNLNQMIWKVPEIIATLSDYFTLAPGDVIMTGTPSGVAAVSRGDRLEAHVDGVGDLEVLVV